MIPSMHSTHAVLPSQLSGCQAGACSCTTAPRIKSCTPHGTQSALLATGQQHKGTLSLTPSLPTCSNHKAGACSKHTADTLRAALARAPGQRHAEPIPCCLNTIHTCSRLIPQNHSCHSMPSSRLSDSSSNMTQRCTALEKLTCVSKQYIACTAPSIVCPAQLACTHTQCMHRLQPCTS